MANTYWDWRTKGNCAALTPNAYEKLFFPEKGRSIKQAKAFCLGCPVADQCLETALSNDEYGIWGGTNREERRQILKFKEGLNKGPVRRKNLVFH